VADRVTVLCEDYRKLAGQFGKLVSIEMIEAVGYEYFDTYFRACSAAPSRLPPRARRNRPARCTIACANSKTPRNRSAAPR